MNSRNTEYSHQETLSKTEGCCMAFTPQSCSTRGGELVFITYSEDFPLPSAAEFFLVYEGSNQRHVCTTQQINHYTLRTIIPEHDNAEKVSLSLYCLKDQHLDILSCHKFSYYLDTEQVLAELFAQHASNYNFLNNFVSLCGVCNDISGEVRDTLDSRITSAFELLDLSPSWALLDDTQSTNGIQNGFETVLHLCAHLGFSQFAEFLLGRPGADVALSIRNKDGKLPLDIAKEKGSTLLIDAFARNPGRINESRVSKDNLKPCVKKSEIGTTAISSYKMEHHNSLEKDIDMLREMNNLVKDELNRRIPVFKHSWPVVKSSTVVEEGSSGNYETSSEDHQTKAGDMQINSTKMPGSNRQLLEQNLKRLRDINEEIQRLRVNSQRNSRESGRGSAEKRQLRRLSCPSFRGQDILQAHMMIGKPVKREEILDGDGTVIANDKKNMLDRYKSGMSTGETSPALLGVQDSTDMRRRSWGNEDDEDKKPGFHRRVSSSLDDLSVSETPKKKRDSIRSKTQVINLPKHFTKQEENNKLADILDSIKTASEVKQNQKREQREKVGDVNQTSNPVSMQGKSYSYSCLSDLQFDDGVDSANSGDTIAGPEDSAEDSEELTEKDKPPPEKGLRRFSMLFGSKSAKHSKRELPKPGHSKTNVRGSMRKEKGQSMINLSVKDAEFRDRSDLKDNSVNKTALGRRASGLGHKGSRLGETPTLPNPVMLTKMGNHSNKLPVASHSFRSTSPLPFRRNLNPSQDEGDDKSISGISLEGSGDEEMEEDGVFAGEGWTDSDLEFKEEADAWSLTVDKKILKRMTAKDIKRQDVIHELIQTEVHYVRTLKIMTKIFYSGMMNDLHMTKETLDRIFPQIEELLDIHSNFLTRLKEKQDEETIVDKIGYVLEEQFIDQSGNRMKVAYGDFCSHHIEAVDLYKKKLKNDKKFADFVKKCSVNKICRRLSVPECITLVTQRLTKYPLLFEAIAKTTKESKPDYGSLKKANVLVKEVLQSVDNSIKEYEKQKTLQDIQMRMDLKVTITYKGGKKVKNIDFASNTSTLLHVGVLLWKTARGKLTESLVMILEDMLVFLQEKDQKYTLLSLDQKAPVIRLRNLFVREVATDTKAIFLVSTSREGPEMYEMVCSTTKGKRTWIKNIKEAIAAAAAAPKDTSTGELITTAAGEKRKLILRRVEVLIDQIQNMETEDRSTCCKFFPEMQELIAQLEAEMANVKGPTKEELVKTRESLVQVMKQVQDSLSSEEHDSYADDILSIGDADQIGCKRAETFSGFDTKLKPMTLEQSVARASSMKVERNVKSYNRQLPDSAAMPPPESGSPQTKHKRRGSGGGWSLKTKSKDDKDFIDSTDDVVSSPTSSSPVNTPDQDTEENGDSECTSIASSEHQNCASPQPNQPTQDVIYF